MARIDLDLAHSYKPSPACDEDYALLPLKMTFADGGAYALLGPSGCGKTTMLNLVSGLLAPSRGSVSFDGRDVTRQTPQQRNIAQVFQFPVIYDTMTVAENLAFPLRNRQVPEAQIGQRVGEIAEMLELSGQLGQRGDEVQQRGLAAARGAEQRVGAAVLERHLQRQQRIVPVVRGVWLVGMRQVEFDACHGGRQCARRPGRSGASSRPPSPPKRYTCDGCR